MLLEAIYHRPKQNWSYAYDAGTIHLRLRTKKDDIKHVDAIVFDKYAIDKTLQEIPMNQFASDELFDYWQATVKPIFNRLAYGFKLISQERSLSYTEGGFSDEPVEKRNDHFQFPYLNQIDIFQPPDWVKDAVFYQIFPERFAKGDPTIDPENVLPWGGKPEPHNFFGGDLQGVIDHLDHLQQLGINALYFTPIFEATTNHKYDTRDYMKVDPHFGTNETLKLLVKACHERGIRVMLDAVFNHCGGTFPQFLDVVEKGAASPYADWFHVKEYPLQVKDGIPTYHAFAFEPHMPKLNTEHPEVQEYLLNVARYWIEEIGIDGWRLDVANEIDHHFWRKFRDVVKQAKPDAYILGEIWHDSMMWLQGDQFDAVMNYPLTNAILDFFAQGTINGQQFAHKIGHLLAMYPQQVHEVAFNLLGSHDTPRLLTQCNEDKRRLKLATIFQLTFTGTPCIYYGDEIGLTGGHDPDCRKCMVWDEDKQDRDLLQFFRQIITIRHQNSVLRNGDFNFLYAQPHDWRIAYERKIGNSHIIIVMNVSHEEQSLHVDLPNGQWIDLITGQTTSVDQEHLLVQLPAYSYQLLKLV